VKFFCSSCQMASNIYLKFTQRKDLVPLFWSSQILCHASESRTVPLIEKEMMKDPHLFYFWRCITYIDTTIITKLYNEYITIYILSYSVITYAYMNVEIAFYLTVYYKRHRLCVCVKNLMSCRWTKFISCARDIYYLIQLNHFFPFVNVMFHYIHFNYLKTRNLETRLDGIKGIYIYIYTTMKIRTI